MIVMLSVHRKRRIPRGTPFSRRTARPGPPAARPGCPDGRDTPGHTGRIGLIATFRLWTAIAPSVDGVTAQSIFPTHPVDGISAGSAGAVGRSLCLVLSDVPSRRTGRAACLHRLSTGLCTAQLDVFGGSQKTVSTVL
jgi:hypothetical protein